MLENAIRTVPLLVSLALSGCAQKQLGPTCYDGWSTDEVGASKVLYPSAEERRRILKAIGTGTSVECFHSLARGGIAVVFDDRSVVTVRKSSNGYDVLDRGTVVAVK